MGRDLPSPSPQCLQIPEATCGGEGEGGSRHPPPGWCPRALRRAGKQRWAQSPAPVLAVPHRCPMAPQMAGLRQAGAAHCLCRQPRLGNQGSRERWVGMSLSVPTMPGLTALKLDCHIPSGQPFTFICGELVLLPLHSANTNTALNPPAPTFPGCRADWPQAMHWAPGCAMPPPSCCSIQGMR